MKQSDFSLDYDGINVHITISSKISLLTRIFLLSGNIILICLAIVSIIEKMPALIFGSVALLVFVMRYSLWKLYGKEILTINTKVLSHRYIYLFFKTPLITKRINRGLTVIPYDVHEYGQERQVKVIFEAPNADNTPENMYELSLSITPEQSEMITYMVSLLFLNKVAFDFKLPKIFLN